MLGLREDQSGRTAQVQKKHQGRFCAEIVGAQGYGALFVASLYLITSIGRSAEYLGILCDACRCAVEPGYPWLLRCDMQLTPAELGSTVFAAHLKGHLAHPLTDRGTCRGGTGTWGTIDYFVVDESVSKRDRGGASGPRASPQPKRSSRIATVPAVGSL